MYRLCTHCVQLVPLNFTAELANDLALQTQLIGRFDLLRLRLWRWGYEG